MTALENHGWDRIVARVVDPARTVTRPNSERSRMAMFTAQADEEAVQNAQRLHAETLRDEAEAAARIAARQPGQRSRMDSYHAQASNAVMQLAQRALATTQQAQAAMLAEVEELRAFGCPDPLGTYLKNRQRG